MLVCHQSREKISVKRKEIERSPLSSDRSANFASANFSKAKTSASVHTSCSAANWHASERGRGASGLGLSDGREGGREGGSMFEAFIPHYSSPPLHLPPPLLPSSASSPLRDDVILIINKCAPQIRPKGRHVSPDGAKIVGG